MGKGAIIGFIVYVVFGLYFINSSFNFISLPEFILNLDRWIVLIGGVLVVAGGINYLRAGKSSSD